MSGNNKKRPISPQLSLSLSLSRRRARTKASLSLPKRGLLSLSSKKRAWNKIGQRALSTRQCAGLASACVGAALLGTTRSPAEAYKKMGSPEVVDLRRLSLDERMSPLKDGHGHVARIWGTSRKGYSPYNPRKKNQDALELVEDLETSTQTILVLDGHGEAGEIVSSYFKAHFCSRVFGHSRWASGLEGMREAISDAISSLEADLIRDAGVDTEFSGTTLVFCCMRGGNLLVANVGDSRATIATSSGAVAISVDHKPDLPDEKARILSCGGRVFSVEYDDGVDGPPRVWLGHLDVPGLAMSRSIGDVVAHSAGVSSTPDFFHRVLTEHDKFLVSATDGLWEFMDDHEVCAIVDKIAAEHDGNARACVDALVQESNRRWMANEQVIDDTTVAVCFLSHQQKYTNNNNATENHVPAN